MLCCQYSCEDVDEVVELMCDVLCTTRATVRIGGEDIQTDQVQDRFYRLGNGHLEHVFNCLRRNTREVHNIRACRPLLVQGSKFYPRCRPSL